MDHTIPIRSQDLVVISKKKETCPQMNLSIPADPSVKNKGKPKKSRSIRTFLQSSKRCVIKKVTVIVGALGRYPRKKIG